MLPSIFGDKMVLQQNSETKIWGKSNGNALVRIKTSWDDEANLVSSNHEGHWQTKIKTPEAGGHFNISIEDEKAIVLKDKLIGEVCICSGQSNMYMKMSGYHNH